MKINGCDVSVYQGGINFQKMEDAGAKYVFLRKQTGYYGDVKFFANLEAAKQTNLKIGVYGVPYAQYDIQKQFSKFIEGISPSDLDFPPVADIEVKTTLVPSVAIGRILDYLNKLKAWWGDSIIYTAKYVWEQYYSNKAGWIDDWDLWVANYRTGADEPYYVPGGWMKRANGQDVSVENSYAIWQHSADGNGLGAQYGVSSADIDLDWMQQWFWDKHIVQAPPSGEKSIVTVSYDPTKITIVLNEITP